MSEQILETTGYITLLNDIRDLIENSKKEVEAKINSILAQTYWQVGKRISDEDLSEKAQYSISIIEQLEKDLNLGKSTIFRATKLYKTYPQGLDSESLTWSHYRKLIAIKDEDLRESLEKKIQEESWSVAKLVAQIEVAKTNHWQLPGEKFPEIGSQKNIKRPTNSDYLYKAKIVKVVDGDTLILNIDLGFQVQKEQRVRLSQINAPEINSAKGKRAFEYLRDLAARVDSVVVKTNKVDIYGRYLGDVFYSNEEANQSQSKVFKEGVYLSAELVRKGFAEVY